MSQSLKSIIDYGVSLGYKEKHDKELQIQQIIHQQQIEMMNEKEKLKVADVDEVSVKF